MDQDLVSLAQYGCESYINANYFYESIVTQGPLSKTLESFWTMVFTKAQHVICLTEAYDGKGNEKCFPYWEKNDSGLLFSSENKLLNVFLQEGPVDAVTYKGEKIVKRVFRIERAGQQKEVHHWHYVNWSDSKSCSPYLLARLICHLVGKGKHIVHGSAGMGRSGVFAVVYYSVNIFIEHGVPVKHVDIDSIITILRRRRPGSVQTPEQYVLISDTIQAVIMLRMKLHSGIMSIQLGPDNPKFNFVKTINTLEALKNCYLTLNGAPNVQSSVQHHAPHHYAQPRQIVDQRYRNNSCNPNPQVPTHSYAGVPQNPTSIQHHPCHVQSDCTSASFSDEENAMEYETIQTQSPFVALPPTFEYVEYNEDSSYSDSPDYPEQLQPCYTQSEDDESFNPEPYLNILNV